VVRERSQHVTCCACRVLAAAILQISVLLCLAGHRADSKDRQDMKKVTVARALAQVRKKGGPVVPIAGEGRSRWSVLDSSWLSVCDLRVVSVVTVLAVDNYGVAPPEEVSKKLTQQEANVSPPRPCT
jgi:membrane protein implicated in regulation of membrane protease activity